MNLRKAIRNFAVMSAAASALLVSVVTGSILDPVVACLAIKLNPSVSIVNLLNVA